MYCNTAVVLKINSVYKQKKNYHPQVHVEECKCSDAGDQQCKKKKETVLTCLRVTKLIINEQDVAART